nr:MAG TPA: SNARE Vesicle transport v-SNARE protein N-terminus [Caudoviricetes sp.]
MVYSKQQMIESLKHSIEQAEARIEELKKPSQKSAVHMRAAERDFWRKKIKKYKEELKELEDECKTVD